MTLEVDLLRAVCRANINGIDVYRGAAPAVVVQVVGTRNDTDEVAVEFVVMDSPTLIADIAEHFGVTQDFIHDGGAFP